MIKNNAARLIGSGLLIAALASEAFGTQMTASHVLSVVLSPETATLEGRDRIRIHDPANDRLAIHLSPRARIREVRLNGNDHGFMFDQGRLIVTPEGRREPGEVELSIDYSCRFDDPAPQRPLNTDNPGYGVSGTLSAKGVFILSGAGWYPRVTDAVETFDLEVDGPDGMVAVTSGRQVEIVKEQGRTRTRWRIDTPLDGISLSAGGYTVEQKTMAGITAATYLFPENRALAQRYLDLTLTYLADYSQRFGTYPFDAFAVVENFFPTGYGFPGYTLMGSEVLRLPFIPYTSLPHEIAHSWWGNGVRVAPASGNWCEGLTTYTADYLLKERQSPEAAMDYRRQTMRNYAALVSQSSDFPLNRFHSRIDPATKVIGYDKSAMVFHMLREELGDAAFWSALRDLYARFLFRYASWRDLQDVFESRHGQSLEGFFDQWVHRPGAPTLRLENVHLTGSDGTGYRVTGHLVQEKPYFAAGLTLVADTDRDAVEKAVQFSGRQTVFTIETSARPHRITADPGYHLFRRLAAEEIPPTINTLKASTGLIMVRSARLGRMGMSIAARIGQALGIDPVEVIDESDLDTGAADRSAQNLLFIGLPDQGRAEHWLPSDLGLAPTAFSLSGQRFDQPTDVLFCVVQHPRNREKIIGIIHPLSVEAADPVIHKVSHYGAYSFLAFSDGRNRIKGTWEPEASPMRVRLDVAPTMQGDRP